MFEPVQLLALFHTALSSTMERYLLSGFVEEEIPCALRSLCTTQQDFIHAVLQCLREVLQAKVAVGTSLQMYDLKEETDNMMPQVGNAAGCYDTEAQSLLLAAVTIGGSCF